MKYSNISNLRGSNLTSWQAQSRQKKADAVEKG
jgi:hypothetical protein